MKQFNEYLNEALKSEEKPKDLIQIDSKTLKAILKIVKEEQEDDKIVEKIIKAVKKVLKKSEHPYIIYPSFGLLRDYIYPDDKKDDKDDEDKDEKEDKESEDDDDVTIEINPEIDSGSDGGGE